MIVNNPTVKFHNNSMNSRNDHNSAMILLFAWPNAKQNAIFLRLSAHGHSDIHNWSVINFSIAASADSFVSRCVFVFDWCVILQRAEWSYFYIRPLHNNYFFRLSMYIPIFDVHKKSLSIYLLSWLTVSNLNDRIKWCEVAK